MDNKQNPSTEWIEAIRTKFPTERTVDEALTRKLRNRAGPAYSPSSLAEIETCLKNFAADTVPGCQISDVEPLGGGASKEQYRFDLTDTDNNKTTYVLRREPPESVVETHRLREYQIMRAMKGVVPIPDVPWVDSDGHWFGRPSLISRFVGGVTKPADSKGNVTGLGTGFSPELQRDLGIQFVELMAKFHSHDWRKDELDAFDIPAQGSTSGVISVINWWDRVWEEDSYEALPIIKLTSQWLRANAPKIDKVTVIHHDYRAGNFLFDPDSHKIQAVLDWELAHLGDYHEDIAWTFQKGYGYHDEKGRFFVCGLIEQNEFLERYQALTGFDIDPKKLAYYGIMNTWKSAIMVLATAVRCTIGGKSHQDILLSWLAGFGPVCVHSLNQLLREVNRGS
ncbi:MAG: phosphotransferase family protein [Porticoccaceae bacterium]